MPTLRCTNEDCRHTWSERSKLAVGADCDECGEPAVVVDDDGLVAEDSSASEQPAHPASARNVARRVAAEHGFDQPPVDVHAIARAAGFTVRTSLTLGNLSARLVGELIEVNADEPPVRHRFSIAHELGHHFLHTVHGVGPTAETEANAFAGELLVPGAMLAAQNTTDAATLRKRFSVSRDVLRIAAQMHGVEVTGDV